MDWIFYIQKHERKGSADGSKGLNHAKDNKWYEQNQTQ